MYLYLDSNAFPSASSVSTFCSALSAAVCMTAAAATKHQRRPAISLIISDASHQPRGWRPIVSPGLEINERNRRVICAQIDKMEDILKDGSDNLLA